MKSYFSVSIILLVFIMLTGCSGPNENQKNTQSEKPGNVIFIHPDGSGGNMWQAMRLLKTGPDGYTHWDQLDHMGLYRSHQRDCITASSHAGATVHAFGVKVPYDTYGNDPDSPVTALSGQSYSIMVEAKKAGMTTALINSGHICEPGTGVFVANSRARADTDTISEQIINSGTDLILSGGEIYLLPKGKTGVHGKSGVRKDGKDLISLAKERGYTVVYNRDELLSLPIETTKVLGVFAAKNTFNDLPEEVLKEKELPMYHPDSPTLAEMTGFALKFMEHKQSQFFVVIEEEGSDNFANNNNAFGAITALTRADDAIGVAMKYIENYPNTMLITAADSDAGGLHVESFGNKLTPGEPLPAFNDNGSPVDGQDGTGTLPFVAKPDQFGTKFQFALTWASDHDVYGAVIAKTHGLNAEKLPNNVDNSDIYKMMYFTLFGRNL